MADIIHIYYMSEKLGGGIETEEVQEVVSRDLIDNPDIYDERATIQPEELVTARAKIESLELDLDRFLYFKIRYIILLN